MQQIKTNKSTVIPMSGLGLANQSTKRRNYQWFASFITQRNEHLLPEVVAFIIAI